MEETQFWIEQIAFVTDETPIVVVVGAACVIPAPDNGSNSVRIKVAFPADPAIESIAGLLEKSKPAIVQALRTAADHIDGAKMLASVGQPAPPPIDYSAIVRGIDPA